MSTRCRAVVFPRPREAELAEVELPAMGDGDVLVEVHYSALSPGTERACFHGRLEATDGAPLTFPHAPGYQAAGVVRQVGAAVQGLRPGDRVFSRNGRAPEGWRGTWWGGHVAMHVADPNDVLSLPAGVSLRAACGLLLAQVGYNGARRSRAGTGDLAVVIGDGLVGQYAAQTLRAMGCKVVLSGLVEARLEAARLHSADEVIDATRVDLAAVVRGMAPEGAAVAVDATGSAAAVRQAAALVRRGGDLVMNGYYGPEDRMVDWTMLRARELSLHCPNSRTRPRMEAALEMLRQGALKVEELITHEISAREGTEAYRILEDPAGRSLGIVLRWTP